MCLILTRQNYNMEEMAGLMGLPNGLLVGAGAGPNHVVGVNCEVGNTRISPLILYSSCSHPVNH